MQGDCPHLGSHSVGVSQGATLLILAQLHQRLAPHFLKFWGPIFLNVFIIHPRKKLLNQNDVEFDVNVGHALVLFQFFQ